MPTIISDEENRGQQVIYEHRDVSRRDTGERADRADKVTSETLAGGYGLELVGGGIAVVLAILALVGFSPFTMTAVAAIAIGGGLLAHGAAAGARWRDMVRGEAGERARASAGGGIGVEVVCGAAGVVLGVLALLGTMPMLLLSISAIVFGGALLLSAPAQTTFARTAPDPDNRVDRIGYEVVEGVSGTMTLVGIGVGVLGILALLGIGPEMTLLMVAMLGAGAMLLITGGTLMTRFARFARHAPSAHAH